MGRPNRRMREINSRRSPGDAVAARVTDKSEIIHDGRETPKPLNWFPPPIMSRIGKIDDALVSTNRCVLIGWATLNSPATDFREARQCGCNLTVGSETQRAQPESRLVSPGVSGCRILNFPDAGISGICMRVAVQRFANYTTK